jgi:hypothetical protein
MCKFEIKAIVMEDSSVFTPVHSSTPKKQSTYEALPSDMIPFLETPIGAQEYKDGIRKLTTISVVPVVLLILSSGFLLILVVPFLWILLTKYVQKKNAYPLAVNICHPFVDQDIGGVAKVLIQFHDGTWIDVGDTRVRNVRDELRGGWLLVEDEGDYATIGYFSEENEKFVSRSVVIINQALGLRDGANNVKDTIDDARVREKDDSGLLERSWLEDEETIEIETPMTRMFSKNE